MSSEVKQDNVLRYNGKEYKLNTVPPRVFSEKYRPAPAETDAQKIERLLREGFTVEYRGAHGKLLIATQINGTDFICGCNGFKTQFSSTTPWGNALTYLAHYREPSVEDVLRKMDEITTDERLDTFDCYDDTKAQNCWNRLSDFYAIARWKLIESNPENNVSL